jgi:hypothetical protein
MAEFLLDDLDVHAGGQRGREVAKIVKADRREPC